MIDRFWSKVNVSDANDCWEWQAYKNKNGYGQYGNGNGLVLSHRYAYEISVGQIPKDMFVLHSCDNPPCCNPAHLHLGTQADNIHEMIERGRRVKKTGGKGEQHPRAKLTEDQVKEIRRRRQENAVTTTQLSTEYRVSRGAINLILNRKNWKHV